MTRFSPSATLGLAILGLAACGAPPAPTPTPAANPMAPQERLSRIVDRYWEEPAPPGASLSPQFMADSLGLERRYLDEILAVPRERLDADSRLTYDIFKRQLELDIAEFTYPTELLPVNPFDAMPLQFARAAAGMGQHPLATAKACEKWLQAIDDYVRWTRQAIVNMREGMRRGYTSPRVLMERTLPLLQALGEDSSASVFYIPLRTMPQTLDASDRTRWTASLSRAIKEKLLPAYRELHDFIQSDYLPRARRSVGLSTLPLGASWYAALVKRAAGDQLTPNEIHSIGTAEVERIGARMPPLPAGPPLVGAPIAGTAPLVTAYQDLKTQVLAAMPILFSAVPQADFEIREFDPRGDAAPLLINPPVIYQPAAPDGRTSAVLHVNAAPGGGRGAAADIASFLQEALPGRHYQSALQQERADLPRFRRFGSEPVFVDGWALYAASLGEEMGLYRDDDAKREAASGQLRCAAALVVDTGLHALGWTRAQALDYLRAHLALDDADAGLLTDRFLALPGQALACKIGELKIRALRARAQQQLGARFDIREFHSEILKDGSMPLDILEAKMKLWMEARR
jgi:uncharacterized protein (DUF885 family)